MAQLLEQGKEESARIRVENIIRQDISVELMEILELYCELLLARIGMMDSKWAYSLPAFLLPSLTNFCHNRECDPGLEEAVKSLIYAAPRSDIKELHQVRQLLVEKFGKEFALSAIDNTDGKVSERVLKKLRVEPPEERLVTLYLKEIARTYGIPFMVTPPGSPPPEDADDDDDPSTGLRERRLEMPLPAVPKAEELAKATPPKTLRSPINVAPPSPSTENVHPTIKLPAPPKFNAPKAVPAPKPAPKAAAPPQARFTDDDELAKRFAALKRN